MSEFLRWLIVLEILGALALPLTLWLFRWLPDRGYAFAKVLGLLLVTYVTWLIGNVVPIVGSAVVPVVVLLLLGAAGWWFKRNEAIAAIREARRVIVLEEVLFLAALTIWTLLRAHVFHPGIEHTEQYMDLTFLNGSLRSMSYPPYDPWMSGHSINYYYFGYLMQAQLIKLSGVPVAVGYNLALSDLFAFTVGSAFSVVYGLTRRLRWSLLGPLLVTLIGNWHVATVKLPAGQFPTQSYWFFDSTRVVGGNTTINEFPFFSFMLGDLHPHVMALPVTILAIGLALNFILCPEPLRPWKDALSPLRFFIAAMCVGSLFALNSWDFPTYLAIIAACIGIHAYLTDDSETWWHLPAMTIATLGVCSVVIFAPFYLNLAAPVHGFGVVTTPSNIFQFLQVFAFFLLAVAILIGTLVIVLQPAAGSAEIEVSPEPEKATREAGRGRLNDNHLIVIALIALAIILGTRFDLWTFDLLVGLALGAALVLHRVLNTDEPNRMDATVLVASILALVILAGTEIVYLRDAFDNGPNYRMNTVFKFYYQAWTLLGLAAAYAIFRTWGLLRKHFAPAVPWAFALVMTGAVATGGLYTVLAPQTANAGGNAVSLDGASELAQNYPSDAAAVRWMENHIHGNPVELEATPAGDYLYDNSRVSAFTGLPTIMGWSGHEYQWRGNDPEIASRVRAVNTIYDTHSIALATTLLHRYDVRYVFVGHYEHLLAHADLGKFARFMHPVFHSGSTIVYTW